MRRFALAFIAICLAAGAAPVRAADWPTKPIHFIVPFPPGSFADITIRIMQQKLGPRLGQTIVVDNRSGASGDIGSEALARAKPDGYTFGIATNSTHGTSPALNPRLPYNAVNDFAMVSMIGDAPYVLITAPNLPVKSVQDLIALAKSKPGEISYASVGPASLAHLAGALFSQMADVKLNEVPYRSSAQSVLDTASGRIDIQFGTMAPVLPHVLSGKVKALAVTSLKRAAVLPDVPTLDESGLKGFEASLWLAVIAPGKTPPEMVERMNREVRAVLADPEVVEALRRQGIEATPSSPDELRARMAGDIAKWKKLAQETGISMDTEATGSIPSK
ncbi:MAG TPA: tripartite tricarboxylate transporter substrate binding protein [Xanthobacteraceae bacterium]|nr:tripartite tricarboxylate transporter substrate binding protein [Xanthobacteraceae bacterium]